MQTSKVDKNGALETSKDITNILVDELRIYTENTGGEASCLNRKNERHNRIIKNMVRAGLLDINQHENK